MAVGAVLSVTALVQGMRPPVIQNYEVHLPGLPEEMDGTVLAAVSDMHLGSLIGENWLEKRVAQIQAEKPDIIVLLGDIFEGHGGQPEEEFFPILRRLNAPMGVWAVPGNHDRYNASTFQNNETGFNLLRNRRTEIVPGFILAGVDDIRGSRDYDRGGDSITKTLAGRPPGATILLSHAPVQAEIAADAGTGLMLSGHTHGGQIWPFDYLVKSVYPLLEGQYEVDGMTIIVCRGTGTWGPRMRLWRPGEILRVTLYEKEREEITGERDQ